jgi:hypothetical protein
MAHSNQPVEKFITKCDSSELFLTAIFVDYDNTVRYLSVCGPSHHHLSFPAQAAHLFDFLQPVSSTPYKPSHGGYIPEYRLSQLKREDRCPPLLSSN